MDAQDTEVISLLVPFTLRHTKNVDVTSKDIAANLSLEKAIKVDAGDPFGLKIHQTSVLKIPKFCNNSRFWGGGIVFSFFKDLWDKFCQAILDNFVEKKASTVYTGLVRLMGNGD